MESAIENQLVHDSAEKLSARGVTIVVPAYNEEGGIEGVVERLCGLDLGVPTLVLVVNDGSTDGTSALLETLKKRFDTLQVIEHRQNKGYGAALKTGFGKATTDVVAITDADGTYPEDRIPDLLKLVDEGADMAIGARIGADVHIPLIRRPAKAALRHLASYLAGSTIPDLNSGLRVFRRDFVLEYRAILPNGFSFTTTITLAAMTNGHPVEYLKINYAHRSGSSKIRPIRDTLGFTALIIRTVLYFNPLKVFYPVAFTLILLLFVSLGRDIWMEPEPNLSDKTVLMFVACVQVLSVGLLADLIDKKSRL
ncbi:MAG: glycosyltransferase involved in cell wall biosynthesis [Planctomycetota bacterium]|jgi:glycosyltransferase involved in cell wall biosynthesis